MIEKYLERFLQIWRANWNNFPLDLARIDTTSGELPGEVDREQGFADEVEDGTDTSRLILLLWILGFNAEK